MILRRKRLKDIPDGCRPVLQIQWEQPRDGNSDARLNLIRPKGMKLTAFQGE